MTDTNGFRRTTIVAEVHAERDRQDAQWGGPTHDDEHNESEWFEFIEHQIDRWRGFYQSPAYERVASRARFIRIAALAVAAVESIDRCAASTEPPR